MDDPCLICGNSLTSKETRKVTESGVVKLHDASLQRKDGKHGQFEELHLKIIDGDDVQLHSSCLKSYVAEDRIKSEIKRQEKISANIEKQIENEERFDYSKYCFLCGDLTDGNKIFRVISSETTVETIEKNLKKYPQYKFFESVKARLDTGKNFVNLQARYHSSCFTNLNNFKSNRPKGRPLSDSCTKFLLYVINYVDSCYGERQFSIEDLKCEFLKQYPDETIPSYSSIKTQLKNHYESDNSSRRIIFQKYLHNDLVFCFEDKLNDILNESWHEKLLNKDSLEEKEDRLLQSVVKILLRDIKAKSYDTKNYQPPSTFFNDINADIPRSLKKFLDLLIKENKAESEENEEKWSARVATLAHCIISSVRPRSFISSILLSISTMLHTNHCAKHVIICLANLGLCASYSEISIFENSIVFNPEQYSIDKSAYLQFAFDNADHNTDTIDGRRTFHKMGGMQAVTPSSAVTSTKKIARFPNLKSSEIKEKCCYTPYLEFKNENPSGLKNLKILNVHEEFKKNFPSSNAENEIESLNFFWKFSKILNPLETPGWNGFMEIVFKNGSYQVSKIIPLPFVDAKPSDINTVYSTLVEAAKRCKAQNQQFVFVTYDLQLYSKAREILACIADDSDVKRIVKPRLGGFHFNLSYLNSIGFIMDCSGLKEVFCEIYAELSAEQALAGHAYARAVRAHLLVVRALFNLIFKSLEIEQHSMNEFKILYENVQENDFKKLLRSHSSFLSLKTKFFYKLEELKRNGPTAQLWVQYIKMVSLLINHNAAERSGNWELLLKTILEVLPVFHATGHFNYAKWGHIYLQDMLQLKESMKDAQTEYENFVKGLFTIRRTDKFYCGTFVDMVIEQNVMKYLKDKGGIIPRGYLETTVSKWTDSQVVKSAVIAGIEKFAGVSFASSEQHVDSRDTRIKRDEEDVMKISNFFDSHNPFPETNSIMSISSNIVGDSRINCHKSFEIGTSLMKNMNSTFGNLKFHRKNNVTSLRAVNSSIKINDETIEIDPLLIFTRMTALISTGEGDLKNFLLFELSPYPPSLFDETGMIDPKKFRFSEEFEILNDIPKNNVLNVIDGGYLLHKVVWQSNLTADEIIQRYVRYIKNHFKEEGAWVIFDGYPTDCSNSTKSYERYRRKTKNTGAVIDFNLQTKIKVKQEHFLANEKNKVKLISLLSTELKENKINVRIAEEDADLLIVQTAIELAEKANKNVVIVGEDVDLLVLMNELASHLTNIFFMNPKNSTATTGKKSNDRFYSSNSFAYKEIRPLVGFLHIFSGCDTTSAFYGQGKKKLTKITSQSQDMQEYAQYFYSTTSKKDEIKIYGCKIVSYLYSQNLDKNLHELRFSQYLNCIKTNSFNLKTLPSTEGAIEQHSYRVYYQLQKWLGNDLDPKDWGWELSPFGLKPVKITDNKFLIPDQILKTLFCSCVSGCDNRCGCRKRGLKCTYLCKVCIGKNCLNTEILSINESYEANHSCSYDETISEVINAWADHDTDSNIMNENNECNDDSNKNCAYSEPLITDEDANQDNTQRIGYLSIGCCSTDFLNCDDKINENDIVHDDNEYQDTNDYDDDVRMDEV